MTVAAASAPPGPPGARRSTAVAFGLSLLAGAGLSLLLASWIAPPPRRDLSVSPPPPAPEDPTARSVPVVIPTPKPAPSGDRIALPPFDPPRVERPSPAVPPMERWMRDYPSRAERARRARALLERDGTPVASVSPSPAFPTSGNGPRRTGSDAPAR